MSEAAVGTVQKTKAPAGLFTMAWVSVFGVYVPETWQPSVLLELDLRGYEAKVMGHTIQIKVDAEDPDRVETVREIIRDYGKLAWKRPTPEERDYWLQRAEEQMLGLDR